MKATINGVQVECTPEEFVKTMELIGKIEKNVVVQYVPLMPTEPYYTYLPKVYCVDQITTAPIDYTVWNNL